MAKRELETLIESWLIIFLSQSKKGKLMKVCANLYDWGIFAKAINRKTITKSKLVPARAAGAGALNIGVWVCVVK